MANKTDVQNAWYEGIRLVLFNTMFSGTFDNLLDGLDDDSIAGFVAYLRTQDEEQMAQKVLDAYPEAAT